MDAPCLETVSSAKGLFVEKNFENLASSLGYRSTGTEDGCHTGLVEEVVVLGRNYTTGNDYNVFNSSITCGIKVL